MVTMAGHNHSLLVWLIVLLLVFNGIKSIPLNQFLPFGEPANDAMLPESFDTSATLQLSNFVKFYNETYGAAQIQTAGIVTLGSIAVQYPGDLLKPNSDGFPIIAPFSADADTTGTGAIWYRASNDTNVVNRVKTIVGEAFMLTGLSSEFIATEVVVATWDQVGYFEGKTDKTNTFQCVIAFDGSRTYVMFLYADGGINWTAGDNHGDGNGFGGIDGLSALVGFDAGDGKRYLFLNDSYTDNIVNIDEKSNVGMPGLFVFRVDQTEIIEPSPPNPNCPVIGSNACKERLATVACLYINMTSPDDVPLPCKERLIVNINIQ